MIFKSVCLRALLTMKVKSVIQLKLPKKKTSGFLISFPKKNGMHARKNVFFFKWMLSQQAKQSSKINVLNFTGLLLATAKTPLASF